MQKLHCWCPESATAITGLTPPEAAFSIINTGGRDVVINKITVRGQSTAWGQVYSAVGSKTGDLVYIAGAGEDTAVDALTTADAVITGKSMAMATGDITIKSGNSIVVYLIGPDSITINDIGLTVGITVFTSQAMYYQEANIQAHV